MCDNQDFIQNIPLAECWDFARIYYSFMNTQFSPETSY